jgi:hypothetical protein
MNIYEVDDTGFSGWFRESGHLRRNRRHRNPDPSCGGLSVDILRIRCIFPSGLAVFKPMNELARADPIV